jgi:hypothetical protein
MAFFARRGGSVHATTLESITNALLHKKTPLGQPKGVLLY